MEAIAKNIANAETTRSDENEVYRRRRVVMTAKGSRSADRGVAVPHRVSLMRTSPGHLPGSATRRASESSVPTVEAREVVDENAGYQLVHDPHHPDAGEDGFVRIPDINAVTEMVDMMAATRAYEANLAAMRAYQNMVAKSLEI